MLDKMRAMRSPSRAAAGSWSPQASLPLAHVAAHGAPAAGRQQRAEPMRLLRGCSAGLGVPRTRLALGRRARQFGPRHPAGALGAVAVAVAAPGATTPLLTLNAQHSGMVQGGEGVSLDPRAPRSVPGSCPNLDASRRTQFQCTVVLTPPTRSNSNGDNGHCAEGRGIGPCGWHLISRGSWVERGDSHLCRVCTHITGYSCVSWSNAQAGRKPRAPSIF